MNYGAPIGFKDHFSGVADAYAAARPEYPDGLFDLIAARVPGNANVWEPGCGSGQATRGLATRFAHIHATDPSAQQIAQHWARSGATNVTLAVEPGERANDVQPARERRQALLVVGEPTERGAGLLVDLNLVHRARA